MSSDIWKKCERWVPLALMLAFFTWVFFNHDIYLDPDVFLSRDNAHAHLPSFSAIWNEMVFFKYFPDWFFSKEGGVWVSTLSNLLLSVMPHRFLGYLLGSLSFLDLNLSYKVSYLIFGKGLYLVGVYLLLRKVFSSAYWAAGLLIPFFMGGAVLSFLHQENSLAVVFFTPFVWLLYLKIKEDPRWFVGFCAVLGYSLNGFYPQLQLCYWLFVCIALLITWKVNGAEVLVRIRVLRTKPIWIVIGLGIFLLTTLPTSYAYIKYWNQIGSPLRERNSGLAANSYAELMSMQSKRCNIDPRNIGSYFGITDYVQESLDPHDSLSLYIAPSALLLLALLFALRLKRQRFLLLLTTALALLSIGFYGPVPRLLWFWVPGMAMFRQYYHFIEIFNVHLFLLCALSIREMSLWGGRVKLKRNVFLLLVFVWAGYANFNWSQQALSKYRLNFKNSLVAEAILEPRKFNENELAQELLLQQRYPYESGTKTLKPKGAPHALYVKLWDSLGGVHLKGGSQRFRYSKDDLSVSGAKGAFRIDIQRSPGNQNSLEILQFNDGKWSATDQVGKPLAVVKGQFGNISIPNVYSGMTVLLRRNASLWGVIPFISLAALIFGVVFSLLPKQEHNRSQPRRRWLPAPTFSIKTHSL